MHLCKNETLPALAAGFGVLTATARWYVDETLDVLAAWLRACTKPWPGWGDHVIVDSRP